MKHERTEQLKRKAKLFHRNNKRNSHNEEGLLIPHLYGKSNAIKLSWCDDFGFIINDYKVYVAWTHPRYDYLDKTRELAHETVSKLGYPQYTENFPHEREPIYKKVGKSRKVIRLYKTSFSNNSDYFEAVKKEHEKILVSSDLTIKPKMNSEWTKNSRLVYLCAPLEVRNENDLRVLADMTRKLLRREASIDDLFPHYTYSKQNWVDEKNLRGDNHFFAHTVA